jgi:hypothetical protein
MRSVVYYLREWVTLALLFIFWMVTPAGMLFMLLPV